MVSMNEKYEIILQYFREGKSQREISRDLGLHRKTVRRYIELHQKSLSGSHSEDNSESIKELSGSPVYDSSSREKRRLTEDVAARIDQLLSINEHRKQQGLKKQQLQKIDIHELLQDEGFTIGYTSVCNYVRRKEKLKKEAFIRQVYAPGSCCEFDWGEVKLKIGDKICRLQLAVFTSANSNYRYAKLFSRKDTVSFSQAHVDFFSHCKGVFHQMVYDNMRVAISKFIGKTEKQPTESFLSLAMYYGFSFRFCNAYRGNEKGHVERSVEYIRRKSFSYNIEFESLTQANEHLFKTCDRLNKKVPAGKSLPANKLFESEQSILYSFNHNYDCAQIKQLGVDKYSCIQFDSNHYSVPENNIGKRLSVRIYADYIMVYDNGTYLCKHTRPQGRNHWQINLNHYISTFLRKPGALHSSLALSQADKLIRQVYSDYFTLCPKEFIRTIHYLENNNLGVEHLIQSIEIVKEQSPHDITSDKIIVVSQNILNPEKVCHTKCDIENYANEQLKQISQILKPQKN